MKINVVGVSVDSEIAKDSNYLEMAHYASRYANHIAKDCKNEDQLISKVESEISQFGNFDLKILESNTGYIASDLTSPVVLQVSSRSVSNSTPLQ